MDPYKVLGLEPSASQEEVARAYRRLAKKYHPDLNPGDKSAERRMREINAAYEQIKSGKAERASYQRADGSYGPRQSNPYQGPYQGSPFGGYGGFEDIFGEMFGRQYGASPLRQARLLLQMGRYAEALRLLSQIAARDAEWYYLAAVAHAGVGDRVTALHCAQQAAGLEPDNAEYAELLSRMQQGGDAYRQSGQRQGYDMRSLGRGFFKMLLAQIVCCLCSRCFCCC
ncbi:MAG: DnaJ domain-containing protein [Clostridiales bacterium]|nr:DnaJ domain-containing protein [Clostridiales bacterium]